MIDYSWKKLIDEKPPYFEVVQLWLSDNQEYNEVPFAYGALLPGTVFDEFHKDFWIDSTLSDSFLEFSSIVCWRLIEMSTFMDGRPRVRFVENPGTYNYEFYWSPPETSYQIDK